MVHYRKDRYTDQQNRIESPDIDPQIYGQLIFKTACKGNTVEKGKSFKPMMS